MSFESVMPSNHLILCQPPHVLPSVFPSIRSFFDELALHISWPKCWSFSFSISPSNEYSGLIFFRIDWFNLLAVQGILNSLLQHHNSKASILGSSQLSLWSNSHIHMTTGRTVALTMRIFVSIVTALIFRSVIALSSHPLTPYPQH